MRLRLLLMICGATLFCGAPLASARALDLPHNITVEADGPNGTVVNYKAGDATCAPAPGLFPLGTTTVDCGADGTFTVTVEDTKAPVLNGLNNITDTTSDPGGKAESFSITATDVKGVDPSPVVQCDHTSGATFPVGSTPVNCTATDTSGNQSDGHFTVTISLVDTTPPVLSVPSSFSAETESPSGRSVTYSATATDNVDPSPTVNCSPASGSNFPIGQTTVNCTASDHASPPNTSAQKSFTVTVNLVDHTAPTFTGVPAGRTVEANGPSGSVATYLTPTATDNLDGPIATVNCTPPSGSLFPLGVTTVDCSAADSHGNVGHATFAIAVDDTTPPAIYLPTTGSIVATSSAGISSSDPAAQRYFNAARAIDLIDPHPVLTHDAPAQLVVGPNTVIFHARDASGNDSQKSATLTVLPTGTAPPPAPAPANIPAEVTNVRVTPLDGGALIQWNAGGRRVEVIRSTSSTRQLSALVDEKIVYTGTASRYRDRGLLNGVEYRYLVRAVDAAGNHSAGKAAVVTPRVDLLRSPKDGARLKKAPKLVWKADGEADYYNAQLMLNGAKVLSVWPNRASYSLKKTWKFNGRKYTLRPGVYTWFVWPGYGARSRIDYGPMMGSRTFRIVR
jgi:hypothetical protein